MDIDRVKENIQPLRGGRDPARLGAALQPDAQRLLQAQRREREEAIQNYAGPDPLEPWFELVQWVEQSYPKHGHEGNMDKLIKECLTRFENDQRYAQDRRYVRLWIKFIDSSNNPLELCQLLYDRGIGTTCAELYRAWAMYCEEAEDFPKAERVFNLGLQARAQPDGELQEAHMAFQICFAQRTLHDDSPTKRKAASALAETRLALTSLRAVKRRNTVQAPNERTGDAVQRTVPGTLRQDAAAAAASARPQSNIMIDVYDENPGPSTFPASHDAQPRDAAADQPPPSLLQSCDVAENQKEVGIWTSSKTEKLSVANNRAISAPTFSLYEDDTLRLSSNHLPYCLDDLSTFKVPLFYPDPPDPNKIPMYNKKEVYVENEKGEMIEFSLEQIKARKYKRKEPKKEEKFIEESPLSGNPDFNLEKVITQTDSLLNTDDPNALVVLENCDNNYLASDNKSYYESNGENAENGPTVAPLGENYVPATTAEDYNAALKKNVVVDFDRSLMANLNNESMTINTKAAHQTLNLFNESGPSMPPAMNRVEPLQFDIREDHSMTMAAIQAKCSNRAEVRNYDGQVRDENAFDKDLNNAPKVFNYDDDTSTHIFSSNVRSASTPCNNLFKTPMLKESAPPRFSLGDCPDAALEKPEAKQQQQTSENARGTDGLYPIMETTREYRSGSSSSGSNFTTRNTLYGYTGRETSAMPSNALSEKTQDSNVNQENSYQHFADSHAYRKKSFGQKMTPANNTQRQPHLNYPNANEHSMHPTPSSVNQQPHQQHSLDHPYHKSPINTYAGYAAAQRTPMQYHQNSNQAYPHAQYPNAAQNTNYDYHHQNASTAAVPYSNTGYQSPQQQAVPSPNPHALFQSPPHVAQGYQSPQQNVVPQHTYHSPEVAQHAYHNQHGFQSPQQHGFLSPPHHGYQSPHHGFQSPQQQGFLSPQNTSQHGFASPQQSVGFQSPQQDYLSQHQTGHQHVYVNSHQNYASPQYYQDNHQSYHHQTHNQAGHVAAPVVYQNSMHASANYPNMQHSYSSPSQYGNVHNSQHHVYQQNNSYPNQIANHSYHNHSRENYPNHYAVNQSYNNNQNDHAKIQHNNTNNYHNAHHMQNSQYDHSHAINQQSIPHNIQTPVMPQNNYKPQYTPNNLDSPKQVHQSSTSKLRSVRHEVPHHAKANSERQNQPRDNANTPKFSNSPTIAQKMHRNLYVSSPEQAQVPPNAQELSHIDISKGDTLRMLMHSNILVSEKSSKDVSKRQLDFDGRSSEPQSEDSRDSFGRPRPSSKSYAERDPLQMDVDSENSMDCQNLTFKSNCSNGTIATEDIPRPAAIDFPSLIDPFNTELCNSLLQYVKFPNKNHCRGYYELKTVPKLQQGTLINVDKLKFSVEKQLGKGTFGSVFRGYDSVNQEPIALKYQKPGHPWEYYICQEIKARITDPFMLPGYMDIRYGFFGDHSSIFVSELSVYGSLLDVANRIKAATNKCIGELIVMLLASEMLSIIYHLHKVDIIHADIKPDNFLVMKIPQTESRAPSLQLIDFGCAIDMSLFPKDTSFKKVISTDGFTCAEMRDGRPWTYQTDLYCLAGTVYVILMGNYMQTIRRRDQWVFEKKWPRYMKSAIWDKVFTTLLNVKDCNSIPDLLEIKDFIDECLRSEDSSLLSQLRNFEHVLKCK